MDGHEGGARLREFADAELLVAVRDGDTGAFAELWHRHAAAGTQLARHVSSTFDADDLVAEAFARILRAVTRGRGPQGAFRSYLYSTIRNTAYSWQRSHRYTQELDDTHDRATDQRTADVLAALDGSPSVDAFNNLPRMWQEVLWYVDIEGMPATEVAPILGIAPNAVAARTYRAREGLRQAWIQAQLNAVTDGSEHHWALERMGRFVRGGLTRKAHARVKQHLAECTRCSLVHVEAQQISSRLALSLVPAITGLTGVGLTDWLSLHDAPTAAGAAAGTQGAVGDLVKAGHPLRRTAFVAGASAGVLALAALTLPAILADPEDSAATESAGGSASAPAVPPLTPGEFPRTPREPEPPVAIPTTPPPEHPTATTVSEPQPRTPPELTAPVVTAPGQGALTNRALLPLKGTATPGASIIVRASGREIASTYTGQDGTWALTADTSSLNEGDHRLTIISRHKRAIPTKTTLAIRLDRSVSIPSKLAATTTSDAVVITGLADPGSLIHIQGVHTDVTVKSDTNGRWATTLLTTLPAGYSTITAFATDDAGNTSPTSAPLGVRRP